jgi:hypothetical protein
MRSTSAEPGAPPFAMPDPATSIVAIDAQIDDDPQRRGRRVISTGLPTVIL